MTFGNERDVEVPQLLAFLRELTPAPSSLLDVGAHYSAAYYAPAVREILGGDHLYAAIDLAPCERTEKIVDRYFVGDILDASASARYDTVISVSTIEHVGMKTDANLIDVIDAIARVTRRALFLSFPFGSPGEVEGEYQNIDRLLLASIRASLLEAGLASSASFFYSPAPLDGPDAWARISESDAGGVELNPRKGVQCVGILRSYRT